MRLAEPVHPSPVGRRPRHYPERRAEILNEQRDIEVAAEAGDGESAIVLYRQERPDVALLDIRMPKVEGTKVVERIRRDCPEAVLVVLTTFDTDDDIDRASTLRSRMKLGITKRRA